MRPGKPAVYVGPGGSPLPATVRRVVGTGASGYKVLDLDVSGRAHKDVAHRRDVEAGPYWLEVGEEVPKRPKGKPKGTKKT